MGFAILVPALVSIAGTPPAIEVLDPGQGPVPLLSRGSGARELSAIAWVGGGRFLVAGDDGQQAIWDAWVDIDPASGRILARDVVARIEVPGLGTDVEGIAIDRRSGSLLAADEASIRIRRFDLASFAACGGISVPAVCAAPNARPNLGFESLGCLRGEVWTANEESYVSDGPVSSTSSGSLVRMQRLGRTPRTDGQWAYRCDPISAMTDVVDAERSGVVDVVAIDPETLLVLERELGGSVIPDFRSRIYAVSVRGATDVSRVAMLAAGGPPPLRKSLLWERRFPFSNFEGMTLGPPLAGGRRSILLVSDDGGGIGGQNQRLLALVLHVTRESPCDLDQNGTVDGRDLRLMLRGWGPALDPSPADVNQDCVVDGEDIGLLLAAWGPCVD